MIDFHNWVEVANLLGPGLVDWVILIVLVVLGGILEHSRLTVVKNASEGTFRNLAQFGC